LSWELKNPAVLNGEGSIDNAENQSPSIGHFTHEKLRMESRIIVGHAFCFFLKFSKKIVS
jgi:hypothetical protein